MKKSTILITDDSKLNREILTDILGGEYDYLYASNGAEMIELLNRGDSIDLVLLDINMPVMNGFEVMRVMSRHRWIEEIPVVVISAENDAAFIKRAYELGAVDYITRPFNTYAVRHRTKNTLMLYSRQKRLAQIVEEQVYEREKTSTVMINILSHVIETRNSESGSHILNMRKITALLLHRLVEITDRYHLTEMDISTISMLSSLHDIGKISIPEKILNKPGKLTDREWEIMKTHTVLGDKFLSTSPVEKNEPLMKIAHAICRWHHERWDGSGYPDGLRGDDIPISAQAVSIADVYDALTSERCYKNAFSHEEAIAKILGGECGVFNPALLQALRDIEGQLGDSLTPSALGLDYKTESHRLAGEILSENSLPLGTLSQKLLAHERTKKEFFARQCGGFQFEYDKFLGKVVFVDRTSGDEPERKVFSAADGNGVKLLSQKDMDELKNRLKKTTVKNPEITMTVLIPAGSGYRWHHLTARAIWSENAGEYTGVLGQFTDIHDEIVKSGLNAVNAITEDDTLSEKVFDVLENMFGKVRIVDPETHTVLEPSENGELIETEVRCYELWGRKECCENCSSKRAIQQKNWIGKLEISNGKMYSVLSKHTVLNGRSCVLEIAFGMDNDTAAPTSLSAERTNILLLNFYRDALTNAYSRMYLEDFMPNLENSDGVAVIDVDGFKKINDTFGHQIGDIALKHIAETIQASVTENDALIRYGGDEFLLIFPRITETEFYKKLEDIEDKIRNSVLENFKSLRLSVTTGGAYKITPLQEAIARADKEMYTNKLRTKNRPL